MKTYRIKPPQRIQEKKNTQGKLIIYITNYIIRIKNKLITFETISLFALYFNVIFELI